MSTNRFVSIISSLHFADNSSMDENDYLFQVRPPFDNFNSTSVSTLNSTGIVTPLSNRNSPGILDDPESLNFSDYDPDDMRITNKYLNSFDCKIENSMNTKSIDNYFKNLLVINKYDNLTQRK